MNQVSGQLSQWLTLFAQNIALGFVAIAAFGTVWAALEGRARRFEPYILGALFGGVGLISMMITVRVSDGVYLDMRNCFVLVGGLFGGPVGAGVAAALTSLYRLDLGGSGVLSGIVGIWLSGALGALVSRRFGDNVRDFGVIEVGAVGLLNAILMVIWTRAYFSMAGIPAMSAPIDIAFVVVSAVTAGLLGIAMSMSRHRTWRRSHRRLADILETVSDIVWEHDDDERFTYVSPRYCELLGYTFEEILGRTGESFGGAWIDEATRVAHATAIAQRMPFNELRYNRPTKDGGRKILSVSGRPAYDERGRFFGFRGTATDITERENLRSLVDAISGRVDDVVGEAFLISLVKSVADVLQVDVARVARFDLAAGTVSGLFTYVDRQPSRNDTFSYKDLPTETVAAGKPLIVARGLFARYPRMAEFVRGSYESYAGVPLIGAKGEVLGALAVLSHGPWERPERIEATLNLFVGRAAAELERIVQEEQAELGRRRMAEVLAALDIERDAIVLTDDRGMITYVNRSAIEILGLERAAEEIVGSSFRALAADGGFQSIADAAVAILAKFGEWAGTGQWNRPRDGKTVIFDARARTLPNGGTVTVFTDATERHRLEERLRRSHDGLLRAQHMGRIGSAEIDLREDTAIWSEEQRRIFGIEPGRPAPSREEYLAMIHPDDRARVGEHRRRNDTGEVLTPIEFRIVRGDGEVRWIHREVELMRDADGAPATLFTTQQDVTERRRLEERLRTSHEDLVRAQRIGRMGSASIDLANGRAIWSEGMREIYGIDAGEEPQTFEGYLELVHPDDRPRLLLLRARNKRGEGMEPIDYRILRRDGEVRWLHVEQELRRDASGAVTTLFAMHKDITEHKRLEAELRSSQESLIHAQRMGRIGSAEVDVGTQRATWSEGLFAIYGIGPDRVPRDFESYLEFVHPEDRASVRGHRDRMLASGRPEANEFRVLRPDGKVVWIHQEIDLRRDEAGRIVTVFGTQQDVTERKEMVERLRSSNVSMLRAQRLGRIGSSEVDLISGGAEWSEELLRIHGIERADVPQSFAAYLGLVHPDDHSMMRAMREKNGRGEGLEPVDYRIVRRTDGEVRWIHLEHEIERDATGAAVRLLTTQQDVTDQRMMAEDVRRSHEGLVVAQRIGRIGSAEIDLRTDRAVWSEELFRIYGIEPGRQPQSFEEYLAFVHPDDRAMLTANRAKNNSGGGLDPVEYRILRADGEVRWIHLDHGLRRDANGVPVAIVGTHHDITERKRMEHELRQGREHLSRAQRTAGIGSVEVDLVTGREVWTDELYRIFGLDRATVRPHYETLLPFVHPEDRALFMASVRASQRGIATEPIDIRVVRADGTLRWVHHVSDPVADPDRAIRSIVATYQDVTERKRMEVELAMREENLARSAHHLSSAQRAAQVASIEVDLANDAKVWSAEAYHLFGVDPAAGPREGEDFLALVHPDDHAEFRAVQRRSRDGVECEPIEYRLVRPDGEVRWMYRQADVAYDAQGRPIRVVITHQDVTEREKWRRLLETLSGDVGNRIGEDFLRSLVANVAQVLRADAVYIGQFDFEARLVRTRYVFAAGEFTENRSFSFENGPSRRIAEGQTVILASGLQDQFRDSEAPFAFGSEIDAYVGTPLFGAKGGILGLLVAMNRRAWESPEYVKAVITLFARRAAAEIERIAIEEDAERSRGKMAEILAALNMARSAVVMGDSEQHITYANESAIEVLGLPGEPGALAGRRLRDFQPDNDDYLAVIAVSNAALEVSDHWEGTVPWRRPSDDRALFLDTRTHRLPNGGYIAVANDATVRIRLEEEERRQRERQAQAGKVEALGNLAGGIAHDFNNLLGAVLGFGQFLMQDLPAGSDQHRFAERIVSVSQRGRSLVRQILAFSRRTVIEETNIPLREPIAETQEMLRATLPTTTEIIIENSAEDATVLADKGQLVQVLVNLCVNGSDALEGEPGSVTVSVSRPARDRADLGRLPPCESKPAPGGAETWIDADGTGHIVTGGMPTADCVSLAVTDTGSGIPTAMLGKILEPFVTTKEKGKGTGLGLAVVHRIVVEHGGAMVVTTREGEGTRFEIILPLSQGQKEAADSNALGGAAAGPAAEAAASILVVDDDEAYLAMVETALKRVGYRVQSTTDPRQAHGWSKTGQRWDVLVTDQTMPHIRGSDLVRAFKAGTPRTVCIICTGFSSGLNEQQAVTAGADGFMLKPYNVGDLASLVARLLAQKAEVSYSNA